jgi:GNAT superfamily N-acetyltransferase
MDGIRHARDIDSDSISQLLSQLQHPSSPAHVCRQIHRIQAMENEAVLVAVSHGSVIGVLALQIAAQFHQEPPVARILDLCVRDTHRRMHFGRQLLDAAEQIARKAGCCRMEVTTSNVREGAHQFYAQNGLDQTHRYFCKSL